MMRNRAVSPPRQRLAAYPILMTVSVLTRLLVNTAGQLFNPFLTIIAAGLGTDVVTLGRMLGLYNATSLFSPFFGNLADRWGYRATMRLELLIGICGLLIVGSALSLPMALIGLVIMGMGFFSFVPTLRAYLAELLPYHQRARGFGILEYSWALSGIVGLFLMGQLIAATGWRAPFFVLAAGLLGAWVIYAELPSTNHSQRPNGEIRSVGPLPGATGLSFAAILHQIRNFFYLESNRRSTWATIIGGTFANFGMLHIATTYGAWLVGEYGLSAQQLGTVALTIGCADLCGSVTASIVADRLGKRRSVLVSWSGAFVVACLLPWFNAGLYWAVTALLLLRVASEYGIISHMGLISGQSATQRGKVMTLAFAIGRTGGTIASFTGPPAYTTYGVWGLGPLAGAAIALAVIVTLVGAREINE
ncbi:MAG: MFS transporter [Caldilineaceae bacterium]